MSRVNTRPGARASADRISNSTKVNCASPPRTRTDRLEKSIRISRVSSGASSGAVSAGRTISARRNAALIRLENSRSENGLVM